MNEIIFQSFSQHLGKWVLGISHHAIYPQEVLNLIISEYFIHIIADTQSPMSCIANSNLPVDSKSLIVMNKEFTTIVEVSASQTC